MFWLAQRWKMAPTTDWYLEWGYVLRACLAPKLRRILAHRSPVMFPMDVQSMVRARPAVGTQNKLGDAKPLSAPS